MLKRSKNVLLLIATFLMVNCQSVPKPPEGEVCSVNLPAQECNMFKTPTTLSGKFEYRGDEPLSILDKNICVSPEVFQAYRDWIRDLVELAQTRCE